MATSSKLSIIMSLCTSTYMYMSRVSYLDPPMKKSRKGVVKGLYMYVRVLAQLYTHVCRCILIKLQKTWSHDIN